MGSVLHKLQIGIASPISIGANLAGGPIPIIYGCSMANNGGDWRDVKPPPMSFLGEVDMGMGGPHKEIKNFWTQLKNYVRVAGLQKTIALVFLKVTYSQIPY